MTKRTVDDIPHTIREEGGVTIMTLVPGRLVFCDNCGADWTDRPEAGGMLVGSKAICPTCEPRYTEGLQRYREDNLIRGRCPSKMSFADWVREELR